VIAEAEGLLHIARIRAYDDEVTAATSSCSSLPVYAQSSTSLVIRTTKTHWDDDHRYYHFQAPDPATRNAIVAQWKAAIARFAALAVLEDATAIWRKFFVTSTAMVVTADTTSNAAAESTTNTIMER
jgi:hypothetical protein